MEDVNFITHDFKLPNHYNELCKAEEIINNLKKRFKLVQKNKTIDDKNHDEIYNEIIKVLDYVGRLSMPAFAIEEELEKMYIIEYKQSPQLGKKLWNDHYESIHQPYTRLKNRCFKMLEELDNEYVEINEKYPPNWKI